MFDQIVSFLTGDAGWMPHGFCIRWTPSLVWMYALSDSLITLVYYAIPITLAFLVMRSKEQRFKTMFVLFCVFIGLCGTSHLLSIVLLWQPLYWLDASVKLITALFSVAALISLLHYKQQIIKIIDIADDYKQTELVHFILNKTPFLLAYWDKHQINQYSNSTFDLWFNKSNTKVSGKHIEKVIGKELYTQNLPLIKKVLDGLPQEFIRPMQNRNTGENMLIQISYIPHIIAHQKVIGFYVIGTDISMHEQLIENKLQNTAIFETLSRGIIITGPDKRITFVNKAVTRDTGYSLHDIKGQFCSILQGPDTDPQTVIEMREALNKQQAFNCEIINYRKDGVKFWNELSIAPIFDRQGQLTQFVSFQTDITERKLQEQHRVFMEAIINSSPDLIAMGDLKGNVTYINKAGLKMAGLSEHTLIASKQIKDFHSDTEYERIFNTAIPAAMSTGFWQGETNLRHQDGHEIPVNQIIQFHQDSSITPFISTLMRDISLAKQHEQDLMMAVEKAKQFAQAKSEFLSNMSHEIRTPMNAILGFSDLALLEHFPSKAQDYFTKINVASTHLLGILNDILDYSKLEAGATQLSLTPFNLQAIKQHLLLLFTDINEANNNLFTITFAPDVPDGLIGDSLRIQQILINLVANASKFTQNGSVNLHISLQEMLSDQVRLQFSVKDTGIGMTKEEIAKILSPFTQADESISRQFGGTGLGLSIIERLMSLMNSELKIDSEPGAGSTFYFDLCLKPCAEEIIDKDKDKDKDNYTVFPDNKQVLIGANILLVEDNIFNQQVIAAFLKLEKITYKIAQNGADALKALEKEDFDLVLMDINMPVMDGYTATREIKRQAQYSALPIIALSAAVTEDEQQESLAAGMVGFIEKPIIPAKLIATLCQHLTPKTLINEQKSTLKAEQSTFDETETSALPFQLDISYLKALVGDDAATISTFLSYFMVAGTESSLAIIAAIPAGLCQDACKAAHKLKPSAYSIGATQLGDVCAEVEAAGKADDIDTLKTLLPKFEHEWALVKAYIQARPT